jgi:SPP1 gp7 family putative phage head morphogenesis protein
MIDYLTSYLNTSTNSDRLIRQLQAILDSETGDIIHLVIDGKEVVVLREDIEEIIRESNDRIDAVTEAFILSMMGDALFVDPVLDHYLPYHKESIRDMLNRFKKRRYRDYISAIQRGENLEEIFDNIKKVNRLHSTWASSISRTITSATFSNESAGNKYVYVAILDDVTTEFCRKHNGRIYEANKGPLPPVHINCRSVRVPVEKYDSKVTKEEVIMNFNNQ